MSDELKDERRSAAALALQLVDHLQTMGGAESCVIPVMDRAEEYVVVVMPKRKHVLAQTLVIESIGANGSEWGVSFSNHNPERDDYVACKTEEDAWRLHRRLSPNAVLSGGEHAAERKP